MKLFLLLLAGGLSTISCAISTGSGAASIGINREVVIDGALAVTIPASGVK